MRKLGIFFMAFGGTAGTALFFVRRSEWFRSVSYNLSETGEFIEAAFWSCVLLLIVGLFIFLVSFRRRSDADAAVYEEDDPYAEPTYPDEVYADYAPAQPYAEPACDYGYDNRSPAPVYDYERDNPAFDYGYDNRPAAPACDYGYETRPVPQVYDYERDNRPAAQQPGWNMQPEQSNWDAQTIRWEQAAWDCQICGTRNAPCSRLCSVCGSERGSYL